MSESIERRIEMSESMEMRIEQLEKWQGEFYEWYKDCYALDEDMAEQVKTQMFTDMEYAYLSAKRSSFKEIKTLKEQLEKLEKDKTNGKP